MKAITLKRAIDSIFKACGIDPDALPLTDSQKAWALSKVNTELPRAWEAEWWPNLMLVESRTLAAGPKIAFVTTGLTEIGAIDVDNGIFEDDPRINLDPSRVTGCTIYEDAVWFRNPAFPAGVAVYLRFRPVCPTFTLTVWAIGTAYVAGDLVYLAATGNTYKALQSGTGKNPATETTFWVVVGFPAMFEGWLALHVSSLRMREEDGASRQMAHAENELDRLRETQVEAQERRSRRVRTRVTR